mgnify:FL=1
MLACLVFRRFARRGMCWWARTEEVVDHVRVFVGRDCFTRAEEWARLHTQHIRGPFVERCTAQAGGGVRRPYLFSSVRDMLERLGRDDTRYMVSQRAPDSDAWFDTHVWVTGAELARYQLGPSAPEPRRPAPPSPIARPSAPSPPPV